MSNDDRPARSLGREVLRSSAALDWSKARPLAGVRRAAVMAVAMAASWLAFGVAAAISASVAALLVGILDRRQSAPVRFRTMMAGTLLLTLTTFVTRELSPWPVAILALLVGIAFAEGVGITVHRDAPVVLQFSAIVVATALLEPPAPSSAIVAATTVFLAGAAQTAVATVAAYGSRTVLEVEATAAALERLAPAIRMVVAASGAAEDEPVTVEAAAAMEHAARALSAAERKVLGSDLSDPERALLDRVLVAADRMRMDATATLIEHAGEDPGSPERRGDGRWNVARLPDVLEAGCRALRGSTTVVDDAATAVDRDPAGTDADDPAVAFEAAVAAIDAVGRWRRSPTRPSGDWRHALRNGLQIGSVPSRFGVRIASAAAVSGLIGASVGLVHGSWAVNAGLSVLRPDGGATLPRLVRRAVGTTIGALVVFVVATLIGESRVALAVAAIAFAAVMYWLGPTNYGLYGLFVTASVLSLVALTSPDPQAMALARWEDTLVGCIVALVVAFAIPVWTVTRLPTDVARCATTTAHRFRVLAAAAARAPDERDGDELRGAGIATRDAISDVLATLHISTTEPAGRVPVDALRATFEDLRACARTGLVAEHLLTHGIAPSAPAADLAGETAALLDRLSRTLDNGQTTPTGTSREPVAPGATTTSPRDELDTALRRARDLACRAASSAASATTDT